MHRIVLMGAGEVSRKSALALLEDLWGSIPGEKRLLLPVTGSQLGRVASMASDWSIDKSVPFELLGDEFEVTDRVYTAAARVIEVADPVKSALSAMSVDDHLVLAWDDDDPDCRRALSLAAQAGIKALDLTYGLAELEWQEDEEELPVTMPLDGDELREPITVFLASVDEILAQAHAEIIRAAGAFADQMSPIAVPGATNGPDTANTRAQRARKERSGVRD